MASNATNKRMKSQRKFIDEDRDFEPRKKEVYKKEPHKSMRYAQL